MPYWLEEKSTKADGMKKPELFQLVEKKGKSFGSIAPIICRPRKRLGGSRRNPMMDWVESF
jgi:hypothetical protein